MFAIAPIFGRTRQWCGHFFNNPTEMRRLSLVTIAHLLLLSASAQTTDNTPTTPSRFKVGGMITAMAGQSGTRNWTPAGEEKFSLTASGNLMLWANKKGAKSNWTNNLEVAYALINTTTGGVRKIDDKFDFYSKYGYSPKANRWSIGFVGNVRTQLTNGYDNTEPVRRRISGFFAPGYVSVSPGVQFTTKNNSFSAHFGAAARWVVFTNNPYSLSYQGGIKPDGTVERPLSAMYGVDPRRQVRFEVGPYFSAMYYGEVAKNVMWRTRVDAVSDVIEQEPTNVDVYWTNTIGMKVNKWLNVNYNFDLYYDDDVRMFGPNKNSPGTQLKSILGVGLAYKF